MTDDRQPGTEASRSPLRRVLVANRGEIALRVIRACQEEGLEAVAVYSEADRLAPHVRAADAAVLLGAPPAADSYLNSAKLIAAARDSFSSDPRPLRSARWATKPRLGAGCRRRACRSSPGRQRRCTTRPRRGGKPSGWATP